VLAGISAGALCWFEQGLTDSIPGSLTPIDCLGFIPGSFCPHFDREPERQPMFRKLIRSAQLRPGFAVDNDVALHFVNGRLHASVGATKSAEAYFIENKRGKLLELKLRTRYLPRHNRTS